jgi:hypothetical protein
MTFPLPKRLTGLSATGWVVRPYGASEHRQDARLIEGARRIVPPSIPGLVLRLAEPADTPAIAAIEAQAFDRLRGGPQRLGPEYDAALWSENRMGRMLRVIAQDARGVAGYGLAQVRSAEIYVYEVCAQSGAGQPGHDIFFTLAAVAQALTRPHLTTALSRPDRMRALARGHARIGMHPAGRRGFTLSGARLPANWMWLQGSVAEILHNATNRANKEDAQHGRKEEEPELSGQGRPGGWRADLDRLADHHRAIHVQI